MAEWLHSQVDVSWLRLGRTADWFEIVWVGVFFLTLLCAAYNWWDARKYAAAARAPDLPRTAKRLAPKDLRAARFGVGKAVIGLLIGLPLLLVPSGSYVGRVDVVLAGMLLRLGFIGIGALIAATATNDFLFRRQIANDPRVRRFKERRATV